MNFLRRLSAAFNPVTTEPAADTIQTAEATAVPAAWIPAPECPEIQAALTAISNSPGVIDLTDPTLANPARD